MHPSHSPAPHPLVALVGRPNVGKSTLFNRLTGTRAALVADVPGLTRDRIYGEATIGDRTVTLIDTGGLAGGDGDLADLVARQVAFAIDEADVVLFMLDARSGITAADLDIADRLRRASAEVCLAANKVDEAVQRAGWPSFAAECVALGFGEPQPVSASHGRGIDELVTTLAARLPATPPGTVPTEPEDGLRIAVVGRPNVGKSTLVNRWLGEERQLVFDTPGTTRDSVAIPFVRDGARYVLIDTAGVRRRNRLADVVEKFSVVKSLQAIRTADVALLLIDAHEGLVDQDLHLLGYAIEVGTGIVLGVNKWDGLDPARREDTRISLARRLDFAPWIPLRRLSALHGSGVWDVLDDVQRVSRARTFDVSTTFLNRVLGDAVAAHSPPSVRGRRIKLRFVHKAGTHPPRLVIHGNQTDAVPASYVKYLENRFREALDLVGTPVRIDFETGENPFAGRRNELSPRQRERRRRVVTHRKSREKRGG